ncbi:hypothetical protein [Paenibacillus selenitireducens]|nr:hypothetical protein [Paenibacillus selenitireducens]
MEYHSVNDYITILRKLGFSDSDHIINSYECIAKYSILNRFINTEEFKTLDYKKQNKIREGSRAYYFKDRAKNIIKPIDETIESGIYNMLSNSGHSFPLGLRNFTNSISSPAYLSWNNLLFISLEVTIIYLASVTNRFIRLRNRHLSHLSQNQKKFIKEMSSDGVLINWLNNCIEEDKKGFVL